jgi:hypothetical protein
MQKTDFEVSTKTTKLNFTMRRASSLSRTQLASCSFRKASNSSTANLILQSTKSPQNLHSFVSKARSGRHSPSRSATTITTTSRKCTTNLTSPPSFLTDSPTRSTQTASQSQRHFRQTPQSQAMRCGLTMVPKLQVAGCLASVRLGTLLDMLEIEEDDDGC